MYNSDSTYIKLTLKKFCRICNVKLYCETTIYIYRFLQISNQMIELTTINVVFYLVDGIERMNIVITFCEQNTCIHSRKLL